MIPFDLKPGAKVRCLDNYGGNRLVRDQTYTLDHYETAVADTFVHLVEDKGSGGWCLHRFDLIRDGDGSDYQAPDDVDLGGTP